MAEIRSFLKEDVEPPIQVSDRRMVQVLWLGSLLPRLLTTPNGSQRLPTAPYDYKHTLLLFSSSMTPTDFQRLPSRELTPQPNSQATAKAKAELEAKQVGFRNFTSQIRNFTDTI